MSISREQVSHHLEFAAMLPRAERIAYWEKLGGEMIMAAADEPVRRHCEKYGIDPKLDRSVAVFHRVRAGEPDASR